MRSFIATVALFAITNARFLADEEPVAAEAAAEAAPWAADVACAAHDTARTMQFVLNSTDGTIMARQSDSGVDWTAASIAAYDAKMAMFAGAVAETPLTAEQTAAADELIASNITWVNDPTEDEVTKWDTGVVDWVATDPSVKKYDEACIAPVDDTEVEEPAVDPAVDSWGLSNVHAAFEATELSMITTPFSAAVAAKAEVLAKDAVEEVKDADDVVTTAAEAEVLFEAAVAESAEVAEVKVMHGTIEGKTGWKSIGGGDDAGLSYQWAFEFKQTEDFGTDGELDFIWAVGDDSTAFEVQRFNGLGGFGTSASIQGKLRLEYEWGSSTVASVDPEDFSTWEADATDFPAVEAWNVQTTMDWFENALDAKFALGVLSKLPSGEYWYPDQNLSRFSAGWQAVQDPVVAKEVRIAMTKNSYGAENLTSGALNGGIKEGGAVMVFVATKTNGSDVAFATKTGKIPVNWFETPEPSTDDEGEDGEGSGDVDNSGTENKEDKTDGASTVTAFGAAVIAAISALVF